MEISQLKRYSLGLVTCNKADDTHYITAIPIEFSFMDKTVVAEDVQEHTIPVNVGGSVEYITTKTTNSVRARWMQTNGNNVLSPRVRKGGYVTLYRLGDTDIYYWEDLCTQNEKRTERKIWAYAADPNHPMKDDLSNANVLEWDTELKHLTLTTSKANGEPLAWTIQLNHGEGYLTVTDDIGNTFYINGKESDIGMRNSYGTYFNIDKNNMYGYAKDNMFFESVNKFSVKTTDMTINCKTLSIDASDSMTIKTKSYSCTTETYSAVSTTYQHDGKEIFVKADNIRHVAPMSSFSGLLSVGGLSVGGAGSGSLGKAVINGDLEILGKVTFTTMEGKNIITKAITVTDIANIPNLNPKPKY